MARITIGLVATVTLALLGQTGPLSEGIPGIIASGSALAVLCWVVWYLLAKYIPKKDEAFRQTLKEINDRHDGWEVTRHEDSRKLDSSLRMLVENCGVNREAVKAQVKQLIHRHERGEDSPPWGIKIEDEGQT